VSDKQNRKVLVNMLLKVCHLVPMEYTYAKPEEKRYGFDLKDFKLVFPELIYADCTMGDTIKTDGLLPVLIRCIQELNDDIEFLESKISALEYKEREE